jgi:IPT/TIG domain
VSPTSGSIAGGTTITIKGENFTPESNQVYIGSAVNWICHIISETTTEIKCITPAKYASPEYDKPVDVLVTANIVDESTCTGTCKFTYDNSKTPIQNLPGDLQNEEVIPKA